MKAHGENGFRLKQFLFACGWLAVVAVFVTVVMRGDLERRRVASWPEVACEIVGSERVLAKGIVSHRSSGKHGAHTMYAPRIAFAYTVDGTEYESDRYRNSDYSSSDSSESRRIVRSYQEGETIKVWYDPDAHGQEDG